MKYRAGAFLYLFPAILYVGVVFYFGSVRLDPLQSVSFELKDKVLHAIAFGGMHLTQARAFAFLYEEWSAARVATTAAVTTTSFGGLLELWQAGLPYRSADPLDFLADSIGAVIAALLWWKLSPRSSSPASS